jgi:hypothetical protein
VGKNLKEDEKLKKMRIEENIAMGHILKQGHLK